MLKRLNSPYAEGRHKGDWWKWKVEPLSVDAVLIYATRSQGFGSVFSEFTFAVWKGDDLVPFTKVSNNLVGDALDEITLYVKDNTIESFGPVRSLKPKFIFQISFEGIVLSKRHKCGIVVRKPKILRWRKDKILRQANSLKDLHSLIKDYYANDVLS